MLGVRERCSRSAPSSALLGPGSAELLGEALQHLPFAQLMTTKAVQGEANVQSPVVSG